MTEEVATILKRTIEIRDSQEAVDEEDSKAVEGNHKVNALNVRSTIILLLIILQILEIKLRRRLTMLIKMMMTKRLYGTLKTKPSTMCGKGGKIFIHLKSGRDKFISDVYCVSNMKNSILSMAQLLGKDYDIL